jgi:hypothetical protein
MSRLYPKPNRIVRLLPTLVLLIVVNSAVLSQTDTGRIIGTVKDQNGAIVPGAAITVTTSKDDGSFSVPALKASFYTVTATTTGLADTLKDVEVNVGRETNVNIGMKLGDVTASVNVAGEQEARTNTGSASMGANVNPREVEGLPINGRQLSQLYLQAPGSVNSGSGTYGDIRFSGRAVEQNEIRYDGIEGTAIIDTSPGNLNGEIPTPFRLQSSLENVQEFRVDSNNYPAEFGTGTGGQISVAHLPRRNYSRHYQYGLQRGNSRAHSSFSRRQCRDPKGRAGFIRHRSASGQQHRQRDFYGSASRL